MFGSSKMLPQRCPPTPQNRWRNLQLVSPRSRSCFLSILASLYKSLIGFAPSTSTFNCLMFPHAPPKHVLVRLAISRRQKLGDSACRMACGYHSLEIGSNMESCKNHLFLTFFIPDVLIWEAKSHGKVTEEVDFCQPSQHFMPFFDSRLRGGHVSTLEVGTNFAQFSTKVIWTFVSKARHKYIYRERAVIMLSKLSYPTEERFFCALGIFS